MACSVYSLNAFSRGASVAVVLVGCLVLVGWALGIKALKSVLPGLVTTKANTALCFVLAGLSLYMLQRPSPPAPLPQAGEGGRPNGWGPRVGYACAAAVALLGLLTLVEYLFGRDLGIDQMLFRDAGSTAGAPGRMSPATALNFFMIGTALPLLRKALPETAIIVLSIVEPDAYRGHALAAGADDFVSKDTLHTDLMPALRRIVQANRSQLI